MTKLQRFTSIAGPFAAAATVAGCATIAPVTTESARPAAEADGFESALLEDWHGPYGGLPPFDRVEVPHFEPAFEVAMAENFGEIERIAADPAAPTFENTIAAMERAGRTLRRVMAVYGVWSANMATSEFQTAERVIEPRLAAFRDRITQNEPLFGRIEAVYETRETAGLTPEQQRLTWLTYTNFVRAGARLDEDAKSRLSAINQRLAELFTEFNQNVLADESEQYLLLESEADLAGLPESLRDAAAAAAEERGHAGKWAITNSRSSMEPFLTYSDRRDLRERGFEMWAERGDRGGEHDNNAIISEILALRAERAQLLGYETHAHWRLENTMAATPARARELLEAVWTPALERVREEVADMQEIARADGHEITIEPWDYRYYGEKVRQARYDLDQDEIIPYMQLDRLVDGMFWIAGELFGHEFAERHDVPVFHPDVRVWEVTDRASGDHIGLFYFDPFARAGKRSGAWMTSYRAQERFDEEITTLVSNNSNFVKGRSGEAVLISWDDARTLFHEFGHALHGLSSNVTYPTLAGTAVVRDFVEFPSQLLEHWLETPEVLQRFAVHHRTGEPIPQELVERIQRASTFNQGFATVEYLASALVDMDLHLAGATPIDPAAFEREALERLGMPREIIMRHRTPHFLHIFGGDSYSAGYYSYLWSDVLTADAFEAFLDGAGPYDADVAARLRRWIFSPGNTLDPADAYRAFRGRDAEVDALMRKRGFTDEAAAQTQRG
jgi:peptidyl-dipeptidase Dcp